MPPVTKAGGDAFRKEVDFIAKDATEQIAAGVVMVPDKADLQHDFAREETIRGFTDQFATFVEAGEAGGGIMHAAWPDEWMHLERNEVLDEAEEIGGTTVAAGAWVQEWQFDDDGAWGLVEDGILEGYSIGAIQVDWNGPYVVSEDDAVDDVAVPDALPDDAMVWELTDGIIREVSAVDIPAVPDAQILDTKADAMKRLGDHLGNRDAFIDEAMDRGHSEAEAERLWDELNRAIEIDGAGEPGKQSTLARAGKAFLSALMGADDATEATPPDESAEQSANNAAGGDTPDDGGTDAATDTDDMTDPDDDDGGDKSLAEKNAEQITELTAAVEDLTEALSGPEQKTAEIEIGGETYEVPEAQLKSALGVDEAAGATVADAIESLKHEVDDVAGRVDTIARQSGGTDQLDASAGNGDEKESGLDDLGSALS
ncbi:XkdF-like putative serine protease domain-containing protein [Haloplanus litoreus]|uniref:XkdF-like putative serine protease domain-containing protein n=1 Tax=Haloplanus litoreus TaxID=767515 RepID=A0ABD5ZSU0_9EURY